MVERVNAEAFAGWFRVADVLAVVEIESAFDPEAYRYEAHINDASIGLMQVLYSTARDRGLVGGPAELFEPLSNIRYGMGQMFWTYEYLTGRLNRLPTDFEWIGAYNIGVGAMFRGTAQDSAKAYVNRWVAARARYV